MDREKIEKHTSNCFYGNGLRWAKVLWDFKETWRGDRSFCNIDECLLNHLVEHTCQCGIDGLK